MRLSPALAASAGGLLNVLLAAGVLAEPIAISHPTVEKIIPPPLPLGVVSFPNGKAINLSVNIAAGAFHSPEQADSTIWTVTARGPVIACSDAKEVIGLDAAALCGGDAEADIAPLPNFSPSIYGLAIGADGSARVTDLLPIKDRSGQPLNGIAGGDQDDTGGTYDASGKPVTSEQIGIHPGGIVKLKDGTFWIGERYAPSLLHIARDGTVLERIVPDGTLEEYARANYLVRGGLPNVLATLDASADGLSLALAPDEASLTLALTGPRGSAGTPAPSTVHLIRFELGTHLATAQYAYPLEQPVRAVGKPARLVEIIALAGERFLTVEHVGAATKLFMIDLQTASPFSRLAAVTPPQGIASLERPGTPQLAKSLLFTSEVLPNDPSFKGIDRIESVARISDRSLVMISDNQFGIEGERVRMFRLTFPRAVLK